MRWTVEEWRYGKWQICQNALTLTHAAEILNEMDREGEPSIPRRVVDGSGLIFSGRHCSRSTPVTDIRSLWIVMSLDKPGPCERGDTAYRRHDTRLSAQSEAKRLSVACGGGRFGVLELVHVVGWVEHDLVTADDGIPF